VNQQYTCNLATPLLVGASSIVEFNVMDNSADNINQLQNVVDVSADNAAMVSDVNNVDLTQVSLDLLVSTNPQAIIENSSFELIVDIVNTGSEDLLGVQFVNLLPEGFSYSQNRLGNGCTVNGLEMTCMAANPIAVGTIGTVIIPVNAISNVDTNATYSNVTTLTGSNFPSSVVTNTNFNVLQSGQLSYTISILDNIDPVVVGSPFMYDVTVENTGSEPISSLEFDVKIPPELTLTASTPSNASCTVSNSDLI